MIYRGESFTIVGYGLFATLNALAVISVTTLYLHTRGEEIAALLYVLPLMGAGVWLGSKTMHILALGRKFFRDPMKYLAETGFYVQGGILGALVSAAVAAWATGVSTIVLLDGLGWSAMLGLFFGRLGCFNYGCCFGREVQGHAGGVCYRNPETKILRFRPELRGQSVHPSQIYTAYSHLIAFAVATTVLVLTPLPNGILAGGFLLYHGLSRLTLERFRADLFFDEGRNWTTFRSAGGIAMLGVFILAFGGAVFDGAGVVVAPVLPVSFASMASMVAAHPWFAVSAATLAAIVFLGYGVQGRKLGTFPWSPENWTAVSQDAGPSVSVRATLH